MINAYSLPYRAAAERERRKRRRMRYRAPDMPEFARRTFIEVPHDEEGDGKRPFELWQAQREVAQAMADEDLLVVLKARQLGISWLACLFALRLCLSKSRQPVLVFSQGLTEATELIRRIIFLYENHADFKKMPKIKRQNLTQVVWENGSRIRSLPATQKAGRSFTAALIILDEYAFMQWNHQLFAAAKPTIDNGGKLFIISSADGNGTHYHQFWQTAVSGVNKFRAIFLAWHAHPERGEGWRKERLAEAHEKSDVYREYPETDVEAFTHASGLVYEVWSDEYNVTSEAEYIPDGGDIFWAVDDGYSGRMDSITGYFTANSHPRVFLLCQLRADGRLCVFAESYQVQMLSEHHLAEVLAMDYPLPTFAGVDKSAAELKGKMHNAGVYTRNGPASVDESIKHLRGWLAPDKNDWRRIWVHPRCKHLRGDFAQYRYNQATGRPIKQFDHGTDALRYLAWTLRMMAED